MKFHYFLTFLTVALVSGKIYDRCELARELLTVHRAPLHQIPTWICIAEHESQYMTHVIGNMSGDGSGDHGLFQINDRYWCSPPGEGHGCGLSCSKLQDDDISDDFICAQKIYKEHKKLQGDGFNAWAVYQPHCKGSKAERYVRNCFEDSLEPLSYNELKSDFSKDFFNATLKNGISPFLTNVTFDAFFTPKKSILLSTNNYLTTKKPITISSNKEIKVNFLNPFLFDSNQPALPVSENTAIKFLSPSTKLYSSKVTSTKPKFPYINRLSLFKPTTIRPFSTLSTVTKAPKFSVTSTKPSPTLTTVKASTLFSSSRFKSLPTIGSTNGPPTFSVLRFRPLPTVSLVKTPLTFSSSQLGSSSLLNKFINPSLLSISQIRPVPIVSVNTVNIPSTFQTSKFKLFPTINKVKNTSEKPISNFRPLYSTSTLRPTLSFQTSKSFFVPSPTESSFFRPSTTISAKTTSNRPVFIFNGVKWY